MPKPIHPLLQAVLDNPSDDLPRMVYADWLEENGEPERAEFIRLQIHMDDMGIPDGDLIPDHLSIEWRKMLEREIELIPSLVFREMNARYERGFIYQLRGPLAALLEDGTAIVRENPVEKVAVTDWHHSLEIQSTQHLFLLGASRRGADALGAAVLEYLIRQRKPQPISDMIAAMLRNLGKADYREAFRRTMELKRIMAVPPIDSEPPPSPSSQ